MLYYNLSGGVKSTLGTQKSGYVRVTFYLYSFMDQNAKNLIKVMLRNLKPSRTSGWDRYAISTIQIWSQTKTFMLWKNETLSKEHWSKKTSPSRTHFKNGKQQNAKIRAEMDPCKWQKKQTISLELLTLEIPYYYFS